MPGYLSKERHRSQSFLKKLPCSLTIFIVLSPSCTRLTPKACCWKKANISLPKKSETRERKCQLKAWLKNILSGGVTPSYNHIRCFLNNGLKVGFVSHLESIAASSNTGEVNKKGGVGYAGIPQKSLQIFVLLHFGWVSFKVSCLTAQSISVL